MTEQGPQRVRSLFEQVADLPPAEQRAFLDACCAGDPDLRARVEHLLACDAQFRASAGPAGWLDSPVVSPPAMGVCPSTVSPSQAADSVAEAPMGAAPALPERLGRYTLLEEIGRGGMGAVLRGHDPDLGRDLAVKVLLAHQQDNPAMISRFTREAQIGGQLQHPGIVPVYEVGSAADQRPYFTMKLVQGRTLAALLRQRSDPRQDLPRFEQIFEQVCQTMAYAHSRGVIHRDLKPANVMVGQFGEVQVMDWGLAKILDRPYPLSSAEETLSARQEEEQHCLLTPVFLPGTGAEGEGAQTRPGLVMGTPAYMAPEQAAGQVDRLDARSDVFGLGAILCEILTGQPPYLGGDDMQVLCKAMNADLAEALARLDGCGADAGLIRLAQRSLAAKAAERPGSAGVLAAEMAAHRESMEARLRQAELAQAQARARAQEERKRRRLTLGLAASVLVTVLVAGGGWLWIARQRAEVEGQEQALRAKLTSEAEVALAQAIGLRGQAKAAGAAGKWAEARAQARRAETLLERLPEELALRARVSALLRELDEEEAERHLLARLEELRLLKAEDHPSEFGLNPNRALRQYAKVLRPLGVTSPTVPPEQAAARIRKQRAHIRLEIVAVLDDWIPLIRDDPALVRRLQAVVAAADPDRWRLRLRAARGKRDRAALEALAREADVARQPPQTLQLLAVTLWDAGSREQASLLLRRAQVQYPGNFWINVMLGWQLGSTPGKWGDALPFLRAAAALKPHSPSVVGMVGLALAQTGDVDGALAVLQRAAALKPELGFVRTELGNVLLFKNDLDGAIAAYRRALVLGPQIAGTYSMLGRALSRQGDRDAAMAAWRRALALKAGAGVHARVCHELGMAHASRREWQQAADCYARAMKFAPTDNGHVWFEYAAVLLLSGDRAGYRQACAHMVQRCGKLPLTYLRPYHVARACTLASDADQVAAPLRNLIEAELKAGGGSWSLTQQAALQSRAGRFAQAVPLLQQSDKAADKPGRAMVSWLWLALAKQRLGQTEEAQRSLERARRWLAEQGGHLPAGAHEKLGLDLHNWLEAHVLLREAEALLGSGPATPK
jgi:serine/threonine-protein kinase